MCVNWQGAMKTIGYKKREYTTDDDRDNRTDSW